MDKQIDEKDTDTKTSILPEFYMKTDIRKWFKEQKSIIEDNMEFFKLVENKKIRWTGPSLGFDIWDISREDSTTYFVPKNLKLVADIVLIYGDICLKNGKNLKDVFTEVREGFNIDPLTGYKWELLEEK
jgi:hypothetical protein